MGFEVMHFIHKNVSGAQIIFGLDWSPLIGGNPERLAQQRARAMEATHYVLAGSSHGCAVGVVRILESIGDTNAFSYSAAAIFAKNFQHGAQACLMVMKEGTCWMVACHAGAVLSHTDRWFADESQAIEALEPILQRFPSLQVHRESMLDALNWPAWLSETKPEFSLLKRVAHTRFFSLKWLCLLLCLSITGYAAYTYLYLRSPIIEDETGNVENLWRHSLREQSAQLVLHSYAQLKSVIDTWLKIPVLPMGWRLTKIQCESSAQVWHCNARFVRQHRFALNSHLEQFKPLDWKADFTPLEEAAFVWQVQPGIATLNLDESWMYMDWMSYLQRVGVAYEHVQIGQAVFFPVKPPLDANGHLLPKLPIFPSWTQRTLILKGPLRALTSLDGFHMPVRWRRVSLSIDRQAPQAINRSVLTLELIGDMFESHAQ